MTDIEVILPFIAFRSHRPIFPTSGSSSWIGANSSSLVFFSISHPTSLPIRIWASSINQAPPPSSSSVVFSPLTPQWPLPSLISSQLEHLEVSSFLHLLDSNWESHFTRGYRHASPITFSFLGFFFSFYLWPFLCRFLGILSYGGFVGIWVYWFCWDLGVLASAIGSLERQGKCLI